MEGGSAVEVLPGGGGGGGRLWLGGNIGADPGTGGGRRLALLPADVEAGDVGDFSLPKYDREGEVGERGDVGTAIGGGGGARVAGGASPLGVSIDSRGPGPDISSSDSDPSLGPFKIAADAGTGGARAVKD